jgi:VIT1/CCC1 family predicted Fe2+/Mn2+ transporter
LFYERPQEEKKYFLTTEKNPWRSGLKRVLVWIIAAIVTYAIGSAIGSAV